MSGKMDMSLDEINASSRKAAAPRRRTQRRGAARPAAPAAPAGGIKKATKGGRNAPKAAAAQPVKGDSKIIVSNLPKDVTEQQIKEYFVQSVGPIKKVEISYGPNSQSRGIANVIFREVDGANRAFQKLNGLLVDGRPIKIEIVVSAGQSVPAVKTLAERTTQPKGQPKSAAADKKGNAAPAKGNARPAKKGRARNARPAKKTAAELDSEMADYFVSAPQNENAGAAAPAPEAAAPAAAAPAPAPAANGEAMDDIE